MTETTPTPSDAEPDAEPGAASAEEPTKSGRKRWLLIGVPLAVLLVAGFGLWWFFFRDDAPDEVSQSSARETAEEAAGERDNSSDDVDGGDGTGSGDSDDGTGTGIDGTWAVDQSIGSFDDFSSSFAGYRIDEELASIGANTAVGRTPDITGEVTIDGDEVTEASFEVDMTTLQSDEGFRDGRLQTTGLETDTFTTATFALTQPIELPGDATSGADVDLAATGELTLHGVTREITLDLEAGLDGGIITVTGSAPIVLADYDIEEPPSPSVVGISDEGTFEIQVFLTQS